MAGWVLIKTQHSFGRLNKLLAIYWKVPDVARELSLLFGGKTILH